MNNLLLELIKTLHCPAERNKNLAPLTTLGVGGQAEFFIAPSCIEDFQAVMRFRDRAEHEGEKVMLTLLGGGSNVVLADGVIRGLVLSTEHWNNIEWPAPDTADVQSGYKLAMLLRLAQEKNLGGLEFAAGIPGSIGGAISGNVGAGGRSVGDLLLDVTTVEADGSLKTWRTGEFTWSYRNFAFVAASSSSRCILSGRFKFVPQSGSDKPDGQDGAAAIASEIARFRSMRAIQPVGSRSAGCTFKNPPKELSGGLSAGQLLDQCGCKGLESGDAVVSTQHANFILNRGHASAQDILSLVRTCQERVLNATGVKLEPEIKFLGFQESGVCAGCFGKSS